MPAQQPLVRSTTAEVVVDVVVRDKHGKPIRNLKASDFTLSEDGAPQAVRGFRELRGAASGGPAFDARRPVRLVSLVFERLGVDGRRLARQAALELLRQPSGPNVFFAVFEVQQRLEVIQPFTNDRTRLKAAVEQATSGAEPNFTTDLSNLQTAVAGTGGSEGAAEATAAAVGARGPTTAVNGAALASEQMNQMVTSMLRFSEMTAREQQGRSSIFSLLAIVREQYRLPGRKAVLYFSQGLEVPNDIAEQFRSVISAANRANVSVYAIDARGLISSTTNAGAGDMLRDAANVSYKQQKTATTNSDQGGRVTREQVMALDRAMDSIRANSQNELAELAESTGGFLIANSNDLRGPLERLGEDLNSYYELTYVPSSATYDGHFRRIAVKVDRAGARLQARSGYFALPPNDRRMLFPYELPLLAALDRRPLPRELEFHAAALRFRAGPRAVETAVVFDVPLQDIAFRPEAAELRTRISVLALLKDQRGQVVERVSRDLPLRTPADKLAAFRQGHYIVTEPVSLPPGRYTLESAVADREGGHAAARRSFYLAAAHGAPAISELALVRRVEPLAGPPDPGDPWQFAGGRVTPLLDNTVRAASAAAISVYFVMYPNAGDPQPPQLTLELLREGALVARSTPQLPAPDAAGAIPYLATAPVAHLAAGQYQWRATVRQGAAAAQEMISVTIE